MEKKTGAGLEIPYKEFQGTPEMLKDLLKLYPWDFVQIQLNYYDWYFRDAKELYEILEEAEIPVMVMEPVVG